MFPDAVAVSGWTMLITEAGSIARPADLPDAGWIEAPVPGTAAGALRAAGLFRIEAPTALHDKDVWYRTKLAGAGRSRLRFEGLATVSEVWLADEMILASPSMFVPLQADVLLDGNTDLALCFRALGPALDRPLKRARWRPKLASPPGLRGTRTTLLGHMDGWCPPVDVVGPWRPVTVARLDSAALLDVDLHARIEGQTGILDVALAATPAATTLLAHATVRCAGAWARLEQREDGGFAASIAVTDVPLWWPHTHGEPRLHPVELETADGIRVIGRAGFRSVRLDRDHDGNGFGLVVNGVPLFARGASWTSADLVGMDGSRQALMPWLSLARDANMNMLRVSGIGVYESQAFYGLCDELGLLVWQDFMFANFDYPVADPAFRDLVEREAAAFLTGTRAHPSVAVLCGGSEVSQQAAMLGMPPAFWSGPLFDEILPDLAARLRPDAVYVANSPSGGPLPFCVDHSVGHYYGVGAYLRPLEDARRAGVRFASECLAFANVPDAGTLDESLPVPAFHHPEWKRRTPRDPGASWDFEDVRDHYLGQHFRSDPARMRREDPEAYLDRSRWISGHVMEQVFAEWRRPASVTRGGLVWQFQDLWPGAGWGVVDALCRPKAAWHALRRAFSPIAVFLSDEGSNGLHAHVLNERPGDLAARLSLAFYRDGQAIVMQARRDVSLAGRSGLTIAAADLIGGFYDTSCAYLFGPAGHDVAVAQLLDGQGRVLSQAVHMPRPPLPVAAVSFQLGLTGVADGWELTLQCDRFALGVHIHARGFVPADNWFDCVPGADRTVLLVPDGTAGSARPQGWVSAVNAAAVTALPA